MESDSIDKTSATGHLIMKVLRKIVTALLAALVIACSHNSQPQTDSKCVNQIKGDIPSEWLVKKANLAEVTNFYDKHPSECSTEFIALFEKELDTGNELWHFSSTKAKHLGGGGIAVVSDGHPMWGVYQYLQ